MGGSPSRQGRGLAPPVRCHMHQPSLRIQGFPSPSSFSRRLSQLPSLCAPSGGAAGPTTITPCVTHLVPTSYSQLEKPQCLLRRVLPFPEEACLSADTPQCPSNSNLGNTHSPTLPLAGPRDLPICLYYNILSRLDFCGGNPGPGRQTVSNQV